MRGKLVRCHRAAAFAESPARSGILSADDGDTLVRSPVSARLSTSPDGKPSRVFAVRAASESISSQAIDG
jgi:hypothetical protein